MLQRMHRRVLEPWCFKAIAPLGQALCHGYIADEFLTGFVIGLLQRQCVVVDESARLGKPAHVLLLLPIGNQLEFESLQAQHAVITYSCSSCSNPTPGRLCHPRS